MQQLSSTSSRWVLPPKRFESENRTIYDPIRSKSWFPRLLKRKWQIPLLQTTYSYWMAEPNMTQKDAAGLFGLDEREFRDFITMKHGRVAETTKTVQDAINYAYDMYCEDNAESSFRSHLESAAKAFGIKPRGLVEKWEVDPEFYPSGYENS